MMQLLKASSKL